ncbi:hypothetical protein K8I31_21060, partial [bacterium]|nr:hypothetical protein [bacterium]
SADEFSLLKRGNYRQLVNIYNWISKQYSDSSQDSVRRDFLYAAREIERWHLIHQRSLTPLIRMEFLRWMTGYGLGISRVGIVRGLGFLTASLIPLIVKIR